MPMHSARLVSRSVRRPMARWVLAALLLAAPAVGIAASGQEAAGAEQRKVYKLWPGAAPGEPALETSRIEELREKTTEDHIRYVETPTMTLYPAPEDKATGTGVIVCPGGGYHVLAWPKEGLEVAEWLNSLGVTAAVLKYRVPRRDPSSRFQTPPLQDVQRALRTARHHADEWNIETDRLGVLGFSAGGHLSIMAGTRFDEQAYDKVDSIDEHSARPNFMIPIYPAYLGDKNDPFSLSSRVKITEQTPPTFVAVTWDDKNRGAHAGLLLAEMKKQGVPMELHVYAEGGHGYGLREDELPVGDWPDVCEDWLRGQGLLENADAEE